MKRLWFRKFLLVVFAFILSRGFGKEAGSNNEMKPLNSVNAHLCELPPDSLKGLVNVEKSICENGLLILNVNITIGVLSAAVYDGEGNRRSNEELILPGRYTYVSHTMEMKPGTYFLYVKDCGRLLEKESFMVK